MDTVKWLVANGADLNSLTETDSTAAERARAFGHYEVADYLDRCAQDLKDPESQLALTRQTGDVDR